MGDRHALREIEIFRQFAAASGLAIDQTSVEKMDPPEPDILCSIEGFGRVAFEMVEIIDECLAQRTSAQWKLKTKFETYYETLHNGKKTEIDSRIGNALIFVIFQDGTSFKAREKAIGGVFEILATIDANFEGELPFKTIKKLSPAVCYINISRLICDGPIFDVDGAGFIGDPMVKKIFEKGEKIYQTPYPMELLVYYELQPIFPNVSWPELELFLSDKLSSSQFRRVWVYDCKIQAVLFSWKNSA